MYLDKLVVKGFKSFTETTEFKFDHPFCAIVGPNGSGKTNVADAMRWVMGEQSLKLMRMKKATDAIFAGSSQRGRLGMAQVDLHINNSDGRIDIEYPEVVISRRLSRDGETEYLVNNSQVRLQDILLLLAQANFGQKSYGVIGQGMITDILNANPQDRKEFFDEATGVKEFQIKRDRAINKLIRTEQNLQRAEDLLNEIEPRLKSLQRQVKKLEKRQEIERALSETQVHYYGSILVGLAQQRSDMQHQANDIGKQRDIAERKLKTIEQEIDVIGQEESHSEQYERIQQEYAQVIEQKNEILKEQAVLKGRLEVEHERAGEIDLLWMQRRVDELGRRVEQESSEQATLERSITHQTQQLTKVEGTQSDIVTEVQRLQSSIERIKTELIKMAEVLSVSEIKDRLSVLFNKQEQFLREILNTSSLETFKQVQDQAKNITTELAGLLDELHEERTDEINLKHKELASIEQQLNSTLDLKEKLLHDTTELRVEIKAKQEKISLLQQSIVSLTKEQTTITADIEHKQAATATVAAKGAQLKSIEAEAATLHTSLADLEAELTVKKASLDDFHDAQEAKKQRLLELQTESRQIQTELNHIVNQAQSIEIEIAKVETKQEDTQAEISREVNAETEQAIAKWNEARSDHDQLLVEIEKLKHQLELIGGIDPETVQEYEDTETRFSFLKEQSTDLSDTIDSLEDIIDELDNTIKRQFDKSFKAISKSFERYFKLIFEGGEAKLEMLTTETVEPEDKITDYTDESKDDTDQNISEPTEMIEEAPLRISIGKKKKKQRIVSGIEIIAQPPGKKLQSVHALSGGEKSMTAIALICAIIDANTPPFVVLDEVEAALDEANSEKFAAIVQQLSKKTQFVVISHNRATMRQADVLFGVTMTKDGTSHILSVKMTEAEQMIDKQPA